MMISSARPRAVSNLLGVEQGYEHTSNAELRIAEFRDGRPGVVFQAVSLAKYSDAPMLCNLFLGQGRLS